MDRMPANDPTPRAKAYGPARLLGTLAIAVLVIAIILLALGVFNFEAAGWF
jgi:hypothetical protein